MKTNRKHGFTIVELVVVIAIIAVLAAVLIPTFASIIKKANDSAYLQEKTNQRIEDLAEKVENQNYLSWEDFEAKLAVELAKISSETSANVRNAVDAALKEYMKDDIGGQTGLTEEKVQKIVEKALEGQLTTAQVEVIVRQALKENNTSVDATTINTIVNAAVSKATQGGVTAAQMKAAIKEAINGITHPESLTEEQITAAINTAITAKLESMDTLTEAEITELVKQALAKYEIDKGTAIAITEADVATGSYTITDGAKTYYLVTSATKDVFSITGGTADTIIYIDAPNIKTINVDNAKEVYVIRTAQTSVHITGIVSKLEINSGRVVIEESATVTDVKAAPLTSTTAIVEVMAGGTVTNPVVAEYQDHGFGTNDFIQVIDHNTVENKKVDVKLSASDALVVSKWTTTNVVLNDVSASNVEVDNDSKERLTNSAVDVTITSGSGESVVLQTTTEGATVEKIEATLTIGGTPFEEFNADAAAAINALEDGTVVLNNNATVEFSGFFITIPAGHNVTIDLNGHTITAVATNASTSAFIKNNGNLTLKDSKAGEKGIGNGRITVFAYQPDDQKIPGYASNLISNYSNLTVESGVYESNSPDGYYATFALDNYQGSDTIINGGKFIRNAHSAYAVRMFCNSTTNVNKVTVNGGIIEGGYAFWMHTPNNNANKAELVINGGEFIAHDGYAVYFGGSGSTTEGRQYSNTSVIINGGTLNRVMMGGVSSVEKAPKTFEINGGRIAELALGSNISPIIRGGVYNSSIISTYGYVYIVDGEVYNENQDGSKGEKYASPFDKKSYWEDNGYSFEYDNHYGDYVVKITKSINDIIGDYLDIDYQLVDNGDGTSSVVHK